ncbi:hypothetical protein GCM10010168_00140 [Actinoplanes ianthinogenes]|uniref:Type III polyketide synthase n=1 Tax=Actinoplanes ianthinogenes TaxID=122358 RepID=A0ABM7LV90_9ACTN|nr:hypothetical protein Aiant_39010 [Actinoplanes ianthinogenes]GGQ89309.1 hypothetical protein GCM10010168_00140 [Actinoplanes ianthinogenes]
MVGAVISGLGVALPPTAVQDELWEGFFARHYAGGRRGLAQRIFANSGVVTRQAAVSPLLEDVSEWSTERRMRRYQDEAVPLGRAAASRALADAGIAAADLGLFAVCSCTGYATPGLDILLARDLAMSPNVQRLFVGHMGCYAALPGLGAASDFVVARGRPALLLCTELTSLHMQPAGSGAPDVQQIVSHALFSDAAAAVVLTPAAAPLSGHPRPDRSSADHQVPPPVDVTLPAPVPLPGHATAFSGETAAFSGDGTPLPGHATAFSGETAAFSGDGTPLPGHATPLPGQATPLPGQVTPRPGQATPLPGQATPRLDQATPRPGRASPLPDQATPRLGQEAVPAQATAFPGQVTEFSSDGTPIPGQTPLLGDATALEGRPGSLPGYVVREVAAVTDTTTAGHMTWEVTDLGFRMGLSPEVPAVLSVHVRALVGDLLGRHGLSIGDVDGWAVHPGGPRILDVVQERLGLGESALAASRGVLSTYGNCSSPTVLLILDALRRAAQPPRRVVMLAFGPGLTLYGALLEFSTVAS